MALYVLSLNNGTVTEGDLSRTYHWQYRKHYFDDSSLKTDPITIVTDTATKHSNTWGKRSDIIGS